MICIIDILKGPAAGKRIYLRERQCLEVGRTVSADFSIPTDSHMSRRHFLIDSTTDTIRVRDVGSSNGTFVNDQRITVAELKDGDTIRAGVTIFQVSFRNSELMDDESEGELVSASSHDEPTDLLNIRSMPRSIDFPD
jgi:pSer/pThr/pTyr-binding forkhead associated (FHA) protein